MARHRFVYKGGYIDIVKDGKRIASCWVQQDMIYGVQVFPEYRKQGYGKKLVRAAIRKGGRCLFVSPFNDPYMTTEETVEFYRRLGFKGDAKEMKL